MQTPQIKFGTDGWRGIIADDFIFDNVALVGSAIQSYLQETGKGSQPLLIGYDRRFAAEAYAAHLANHLAAQGQAVIVHEGDCPTPVTAFGVVHLEAAGAVMLTASHNPHYYQGLKFIPWFGGPAMPETTDRVTALIQEIAGGFTPPQLNTEWRGERIALKQAYFEHLDSIVNVNSLGANRFGVLYNPMHGVGAGYLDAYLQRAEVRVVTINAGRDVYFGGGLPDPSPGNLVPLAAKLAENKCGVLIGTDGDSDRFGIVDSEGKYFGANQALPLLADYLVRFKQLSGDLVRTVSTSTLLDGIAAEHKLKLIETPVGFKYVGDELRKGALIGGEESGGISMRGHIPEKDGILSSVLMLELAATTGETFDDLYNELQHRLGPRSYVRIDEEIHDAEKKKLLAELLSYAKDSFAGRKIVARNTVDGVKFTFDHGAWMLVRASGTEPLIRVYLECPQKDNLGKFKQQVLSELKQLSA
jgi:phosphomannomutase